MDECMKDRGIVTVSGCSSGSLKRASAPRPLYGRPKQRCPPSAHVGYNACSEDIDSNEGNPYEYIEDHQDKQATLTANSSSRTDAKHHAGVGDLAADVNCVDSSTSGSCSFSPDVPPRNMLMNAKVRSNPQVHAGSGHRVGQVEPPDFDAADCLARTPSGSLFITSDLPKNACSSPQQQKLGSPNCSPKKGDSLKTHPDRCPPYAGSTMLVPSVPVRNNLRRPTSNHLSHSRFRFRKNLSDCSWKCTALTFILLSAVLSATLAYFAATSMLVWQEEGGKKCAVVVEGSEPSSPELNSTYLADDARFNNDYGRRRSPRSADEDDDDDVRAADSNSTASLSLDVDKDDEGSGLGGLEGVVVVEVVAGGARTRDSRSSSSSSSDENAISPFVHNSKGQKNASVEDVRGIEVAVATNAIGTRELDAEDDIDSKRKNFRTTNLVDEGFIPLLDNSKGGGGGGGEVFSPAELDDLVAWNASATMPSAPRLTETSPPQPNMRQECVCSCTCPFAPVAEDNDTSFSAASAASEVVENTQPFANKTDDVESVAKGEYRNRSGDCDQDDDVATANSLLPIPTVTTTTTTTTSCTTTTTTTSSTTTPPHPHPHLTTSRVEKPSASANESVDAVRRRGGPKDCAAASIIVVSGPTAVPAKMLPPDSGSFAEIAGGALGRRVTNDILPYGHWNAQFHQPRTAFVRFNYSVPRDANIGVYGRRNAIPTHTQYDFAEILSNDDEEQNKRRRRKRNLKDTVNIVFVQYLDAGQWFLSMYNDDNKLRDVSFITTIADDLSVGCPYDCNDHGTCVRGVCECHPGHTGNDCSRSVCPVLCSANGEYLNGHCLCKPGWKGRECNLRYDECQVPGCNGHGHCIDGKCRCTKGYKGEFCELVDCLVPDCTSHGVCIEGTCLCHRGWKGGACDELDGEVRKCLPDCSGHGKFDLEKVKCICDPKWTGPDCSKELCNMDCGTRGRCESGRCHCTDGWTGAKCDVKSCDPRCLEHGQCKNGTCICVQGWNGRHCTLSGCPHNCNDHGDCIQSREAEWMCQCIGDWEGSDCNIALERQCDDGRDNDNDGLVDCEDSECCPSKSCSDNVMCSSTADPLEILLKKQPPAVTASFFQRMRFLIEEDSVQNYARKNAFNESRASVIRGRMVGSSGTGIVGIRVSTNNSQEGFTVTRQTGWFDLMVNGGGSVTLQFLRAPFKPLHKSVIVPWNEVIVIGDVVMTSVRESIGPAGDVDDGARAWSSADYEPCTDHDYDGMKPVVLATWKHEFLGGCPERSTIVAESQVIQESLTIPGTDLHLMYHSSRAAGYMSTIQLQLTPSSRSPATLRLVHLRISIEGIHFERTFEADPGLKFTYAWNRRNVYRQRVYGVTTATVSVGYEYSTCKTVIWDVQTTKLSGHDMSISDIGGWNLDIHHRYNFHEGILQKGDGTNIYLRYRPRVLLTTMGHDGQQRHLDCYDCNGVASEQRLVAPVALAASPDGSLYVGDFNLVRRILPDQTVQTVLKLNLSQVAYRYHLTVNPVDGSVYLSDPERHQILRLKAVEDIPDVESNYEVVIGSGTRCLPGDRSSCGDGGDAKDAKLMYPKGIVFSADGIVYFADGTNIRMVENGKIRTLLGNHRHKGHWKPIPCHGTLSLDEVHLRWPTELAINPLDGSLHIIDDHMILKVTDDGRVKVVAGQPLNCPSSPTKPAVGSFVRKASSSDQHDHDDEVDGGLKLASRTTLASPESLAFAPTGELYVAESDSQRINRVRMVGTDGRIVDFAGVESKCNCLENSCKCFDGDDHFLASLSKLSTLSSVAVTPDGVVHVADQGNLRVRSVTATVPEPNRFREYEIFSPETQEVYVFNRYGQHVLTKNILTGRISYTFMYNLNTSFGKLNSITDAAGNKIFIMRDYSTTVSRIENTQGRKVQLVNTRMRMLQNFVSPGAVNVTFDYHGSTGLLRSKRDGLGRSFVYAYDDSGRLTEAITPSGEMIRLDFDLSFAGARVTVTRGNDGGGESVLIKGTSVTTRRGTAESKIVVSNGGGVTQRASWGQTVITEASTYPILADIKPILGESFPVPSRQKVYIHDDLVHRSEWRYYLRKEGKGRDKHISQVVRKMKINGDNLLAIEYDRDASSETLYDEHQVALLTVTYDGLGRPLRWTAAAHNLTGVELEYDRFGRLIGWQRGDLSEQYDFDREGRLAAIRQPDNAAVTFKYEDASFIGLVSEISLIGPAPTEISLPNTYKMQYDEAGGLMSVTTPRGHRHELSVQTSLGFYKLQYTAPSMRQPFVVQYNDRGELLATLYPGVKGRTTYAYVDGRLASSVYGDARIDYAYHGETGLVRHVSIEAASGFECDVDYKHHGALVKEEKWRFGSKLGLSSIRLKNQYDGNARFQRAELEIDGKEVYPVQFGYDVKTGQITGAMQFVVRRMRFDETLIESKEDSFSKIRRTDGYGRPISISITLASKEVYRLLISYDVRDRVRWTQTKLGHAAGSTVLLNYTYTVDGLLEEVANDGEGVDDGSSWKFRHDDNGNVVSIVHDKKETKLRYNEGDRLIAYGDFDMNIIDGRGFMVQKGEEKFLYNARAQLTSAAHRNLYEVHYHYDHRDRVIARKDTQGNITQYFYADVRRPLLVTFIHHPKTSQTWQLTYDDRGHLIRVEHRNSNTKYLVATDWMGSPVGFFDTRGELVKRLRRSPFGALLEDTDPHLYVPIDFRGGLRDPITGLVHYGSRVYDPTHTQWMTPDWENVLDYVTTPQRMYLYRFSNNDPMSESHASISGASPPNGRYFTEMSDWVSLFGYQMDDISGRRGEIQLNESPRLGRMASNLPVISGLRCAADVITGEFYGLSFVRGTRVRSTVPTQLHSQPLLPSPLVARRKSVFGDAILVSRRSIDGRAVVNVLEGANAIVADVVASVLNNSHFLDVHIVTHGQDVFHFVKDGPASRVDDDRAQLQRLAGSMFNVSVHDSEHGAVDLKLHGHSAIVNVRYGTSVDQERHRLLKHARKRDVGGVSGRSMHSTVGVRTLEVLGEMRRKSGSGRRRPRASLKGPSATNAPLAAAT